MAPDPVKQFCSKFNIFTNWLDAIFNEENIHVMGWDAVRRNAALLDKAMSLPPLCLASDNAKYRVIYMAVKTSGDPVSIWGKIDPRTKSYEEMYELVSNLHKITGRLLEERTTTTAAGNSVTELKRIHTNICYFSDFHANLRERYLSPEERAIYDEKVKSMNVNVLQQLVELAERRPESPSQPSSSSCSAVGSTDSTDCPTLEQSDSSTTSSSSSTPLEGSCSDQTQHS